MSSKSDERKNVRPEASRTEEPAETRQSGLLIAAVGASAGGIEAFTELVTHLPEDTGMAFVLVQHLDPKHHSLLTELLSKKTPMPVSEVTDGMAIEANHVYVIPPNATMSISNHSLLLSPREEGRGVHMLSRAKKENVPARQQNAQSKSGGDGNGAPGHKDMCSASFKVIPINVANVQERYFMIVFHDESLEAHSAREARPRTAGQESEASRAKIAKLEQELAATKEYLQSVIETQEATNEELQSANEEILSSNEELQSTNAELETAKEELQSANEELSTVNDELRSRNAEITQINNDLTNLFASLDVAVIMVGSDLSIRRFTPEAQKFLGLIPADVGRPLLNINPTIGIPDFQALVLQVISLFRPVEREVKGFNGARYFLRILPYRTIENRIDGAVITIIASSAEAEEAAAR